MPFQFNLTDRSGTIAAGGTAQQAAAANGPRRLLIIANPSESATFLFRLDGTATGGFGDISVGPGGAFVFDTIVPSGAVSIYGAITGQPFTVKEA